MAPMHVWCLRAMLACVPLAAAALNATAADPTPNLDATPGAFSKYEMNDLFQNLSSVAAARNITLAFDA